jgi:peptidyl-tRNA hydrolase, PTH1 family
MAIDRLARHCGVRLRSEAPALLLGRWRQPGREVLVAKPMTFMNDSGRAALQLRDRHGVEPESLLVVVDDLDLPFGRLRLKAGGGPGTHNGMRSLVRTLGSDRFPRLRLGIGPPREGEDLADWVLADFEPQEAGQLATILDTAVACLESAVLDGVAGAMNRFNAT